MKNMTLALGLLISSFAATAADMSKGADNFYKSDNVTQQKVTFKNQYQMNVVGNLFIPKTLNQNAKKPAIVVGHPMGAVKEQSSNLYAQKLAEQGFVTLAIDLSFWGKVKANRDIWFHRKFMQMTSARRSITSVRSRMLTPRKSAYWVSAAAGALQSVQPKLIRV